LKGIILIGGESKRMGKPKAFINIEGVALYQRTAKLLTPFCDQVYLSGKASQINRIKDKNYEFITDKYDNIGPVAGILSAFEYLNDKKSAILVVATDMPFLNDSFIKILVKGRNKKRLATIFMDKSTGFLEPLCAIYEFGSYPIIKSAVGMNEYAIRKMFKKEELHLIDIGQDPALTNINYPDQLKEL